MPCKPSACTRRRLSLKTFQAPNGSEARRWSAQMITHQPAPGFRPADLAHRFTCSSGRRAPPRIVVKDGTRVHIIPVEKLDYVEAQDDYVALHSGGRSYLKQQPIASLEALLDPARFVRSSPLRHREPGTPYPDRTLRQGKPDRHPARRHASSVQASSRLRPTMMDAAMAGTSRFQRITTDPNRRESATPHGKCRQYFQPPGKPIRHSEPVSGGERVPAQARCCAGVAYPDRRRFPLRW